MRLRDAEGERHVYGRSGMSGTGSSASPRLQLHLLGVCGRRKVQELGVIGSMRRVPIGQCMVLILRSALRRAFIGTLAAAAMAAGIACSGNYKGGNDGGTASDATGSDSACGSMCGTPGCCGTSCQFKHQNGVGQSFFDCIPLSTYSAPQANAACNAFTNNISQCLQFNCAVSGHAVCSTGSPVSCICWNFDGTYAGSLYNGLAPGQANCKCGSGANDPPQNRGTWN